jgi:uncharacterized protein
MLAQNLTIPQLVLADFCRKHYIRKLAFFGSVLGSEFAADSDVDILVEFEEEHVPGFAFFDLQDELSSLLGRQVDLHTPKSLSRYFRDQVIAEAIVVYNIDALSLGQRAQVALEAWRQNPSLSRPWEEVKAELHKADLERNIYGDGDG